VSVPQWDAVLEAFLGATGDLRGEDPRLNESAQQLVKLSKVQPQEMLDHALVRLVGALNAPHPQTAGLVALMSGCIVEEGADPGVLAKALVPRVEDALRASARAVEAVAQLSEMELDDEQATTTVGDRTISAQEWQRSSTRIHPARNPSSP
jgi:hypothetical protein